MAQATAVPKRSRTDDSSAAAVRLLPLEVVADRLGTTISFPRTLIKERRIPYVKLGTGKRSPVRIREDVLDAFIARHTVEADE